MTRAIVMKAGDNVATVLAAVKPGESIAVTGAPGIAAAIAAEELALGHKFALCPIRAQDPVVKYGEVIGYSTKDIVAGAHVHVHNMASGRGRQ